jgi:hypothetical protein
LRELGLDITVELANDPFFGRENRLLRNSQREQELKREMIADLGKGVRHAVASVNYHMEHFSAAFGFHRPGGSVIHTACLAFGLDRMVLALAHRHGPDHRDWPL